MNTDKIKSLFADTENKAEEIAQKFQDFVDLIPLPEGVYDIRFEPKALDADSLDYVANIVWDNGDSLGTTGLFRVSVDLEVGYPLTVVCFSGQQINSDEKLERFFERTLAREVRATFRGQVTLRKAGKLSTKYLGKKPGSPEPTLMIKV